MTIDKQKLRELASKATPGPWAQCTAPDTNNKQAVCDHYFEFVARTDVYSIHSDESCEANAAFIAAANPQAVIELLDALDERNAQLDATRSAIGAECVDHAELNGHIDIAEQCRDFLAQEDDPSGKLRDFADSLRIVIDQCDRQRRRANWYEAAYTAGKQKLIESAVDRALAAARDAARRLIAQVEHLGAFVDDNDPRVMATAGPIGEAQCDLWIALGLDTDEELARIRADIDSRCAVCGWPLAESIDKGCVRGNCSHRPRPAHLYAPERAAREARHG